MSGKQSYRNLEEEHARIRAAHPAAIGQHFRVAKEPKNFQWARALCGARGVREGCRWAETRELRESAVVSCPECMVIKDLWLERMQPRKPLTIRRARAFLRGLVRRLP